MGSAAAYASRPFTQTPEAVGDYGPVSDESGNRAFGIRVTGQQKGVVLAKLDTVTTREAAEAMKGMRLYVGRDRLPAAGEDEYYHADLIGLAAELSDGSPFGEIVAVWDFGAGDSIEVGQPDGRTVMVPFTRAAVPVVDMVGRKVVIDPPPGLFDKPDPPASAEEQEALAAEILSAAGPDLSLSALQGAERERTGEAA